MRGTARARLKSTFGVAAAAAAVLVMSAAPASADPVKGHVDGMKDGTTSNVKLTKPDGSNDDENRTGLIQLKVGNQVLLTYCIDLSTRVNPDAEYSETGWGDRLGADAKHVNWILHHSVPFVTPDALKEAAGLDATPSDADAVAGTQAAIWHYSDDVKLRMNQHPPAVEAIYKYLTGNANTGMDNEPAPTLSLSPENVSGESGKALGPIEVSTSAEQVKVALGDGAPEGAKLLGSDKKTEVTTAKNGDKLYVSVPKGTPDGRATVKADVTAKVSPGRVFVGDRKTQTLILASSDEVAVHDEAAVGWATVPTPAPGSNSETVCKPAAGVKTTLTNEGDAPAEFTVSFGDTTEKVTVKAGETATKVIPVKEDAAYKITVKSGDYEKVYEGILDCQKNEPAPTSPAPGGGGGLPETGLNNLTMFLGIGGGLLAAGLMLLFVFRKRRQVEA